MSFGHLRFLVVEDDELQREILTIHLQDLGAVHVQEAHNGRAGLEAYLAADPPVDVIISDLQMPEMDGVEFIRKVGEAGRPVGIVLASAVDPSLLGAVENVATAYGIPLMGTLSKPVQPEELARLLGGFQAGQVRPLQARPAAQDVNLGDLQAALDAGAFVPHFQPKIALADGALRGFEAMARWRRGEGQGVVGPDTFVPLMEAHGLIDQLTLSVLRQAVATACEWQAAGHPWTVSVNLSVNSLARVQFADQLERAVREHGLPPHRLILEVTESASAGPHLGSVLDNLSRLRLKGFGLSLDDFGTGYSSIQQLGRVAFTELKIDQTFVRDAQRAASRQAILASTVDTARRMKLDSVAEGIETAQECALLRGMGFSLGQGYFFGRPMPACDIAAWAHEWMQRARGFDWDN